MTGPADATDLDTLSEWLDTWVQKHGVTDLRDTGHSLVLECRCGTALGPTYGPTDLGSPETEARAYFTHQAADLLAAGFGHDHDAGLREALTRAAVVSHRGPNDTDAGVMRLTARDLREGYDPGGSNRRAAVARVLDVVADAIDRAALAEPTPGSES